ncbi:casein kinase I [Friedmanniomyces endolithicus]|nr:casein kinase I [Friedmanniomyces endolithicus]
MEKKMATSVEQLCEELPEEFAQCMQEVKDIPAGVRPHYDELRHKFRRLAVREGVRNQMTGIASPESVKRACTRSGKLDSQKSFTTLVSARSAARGKMYTRIDSRSARRGNTVGGSRLGQS